MKVRCHLVNGVILDTEIGNIDAIPSMWLRGRRPNGLGDGKRTYDRVEEAFSGRHVVDCYELDENGNPKETDE